MSKETFEEWRKTILGKPMYLGKDLSRMAWFHQQKKLDARNKLLKEAVELMEKLYEDDGSGLENYDAVYDFINKRPEIKEISENN